MGGEGRRAFHLEHLGVHKALLLSNPQAALCALYTHTPVCTHVHTTRHTDMDMCMSKYLCPIVGTPTASCKVTVVQDGQGCLVRNPA